jgi:hypothetical protein
MPLSPEQYFPILGSGFNLWALFSSYGQSLVTLGYVFSTMSRFLHLLVRKHFSNGENKYVYLKKYFKIGKVYN